MTRIQIVAALLTGVIAAALSLSAVAQERPRTGPGFSKKPTEPAKPDAKALEGTALAFKVKDIDGKEIDLADYYGKVLLIVNTASKCGYTPQYAKLQELHENYTNQGFAVLAFPANNFGGQEPGTDPEIKKFCKDKFAVNFPLFAKVSVKGKDICELYKYLTGKDTNPKFAGDITWNFNKFLVDRQGHVIGRYKSSDDPVKCKQLIADLEKALAEKPKQPS